MLKYLIALVILGAVCFLAMVIYAACVRVDKRDIFPNEDGSAPDSSSKSGKTVTVGFFSDTHGFGCLRSPSWIARHFLENHCDVVLFGGDCVHRRKVRRADKKMLTEVSSLLKKENIELFAVYGNHDWQLEPSDYEKMGATLLIDSWRELSFSGAKIAVCGVADNQRGERPWGHIPSDFSAYDGFRLLLVHNPDYLYELPDMSAKTSDRKAFDYLLAGHLHGGQVHLPGNLEFVFFREDRLAGEAKILGGPFSFHGYKGLISNGAGNGFLPIRFCARAEIHILRFHL